MQTTPRVAAPPLFAGAGTQPPAPLAAAWFADGCVLIGCYHPSQQNTFTGKLTRPMLRQVFEAARRLLEHPIRKA